MVNVDQASLLEAKFSKQREEQIAATHVNLMMEPSDRQVNFQRDIEKGMRQRLKKKKQILRCDLTKVTSAQSFSGNVPQNF